MTDTPDERRFPHLTEEQEHLVGECALVAALTGIDFWTAQIDPNPARADYVTSDLVDSLEQMVKGHIINELAFLDEVLNRFILVYIFGPDARDELGHFTDPRARPIRQHILDNLYPLQKLALFSQVANPPGYVNDFFISLNALCNGLAHAFERVKPVRYKKQDVMTFEGLTVFRRDADKVTAYFERSHPELVG